MNVSLNVSELVASALEIRDHLYARHGIYVNRITKTSLLFNFHIGIDRHVVEELLAALRKLQRNLVPDWSLGGTTESFIVPYPPGVPLILPGEEVTPQLRHQLLDIARSGIRVFAI
jgi:arginine/lysine/ornithine decarboxylase